MFLEKVSGPFLTVLDFSLQLLAVVYGVFATAVDFKEEREDGKKRLSRTGRVGLSILLSISLASLYVKVRQKREDDQKRADQEQAQRDGQVTLKKNLDLTSKIANSLAFQSFKLETQANALGKQEELLRGQTRTLQAVARSGTETLGETQRLLDPIDSEVDAQLTETFALEKVQHDTLSHLLESAARYGSHDTEHEILGSYSSVWSEEGLSAWTDQFLQLSLFRGNNPSNRPEAFLPIDCRPSLLSKKSKDNINISTSNRGVEIHYNCFLEKQRLYLHENVRSYTDLQGGRFEIRIRRDADLSTGRWPLVRKVTLILFGHLRTIAFISSGDCVDGKKVNEECFAGPINLRPAK